MICATTPWRRRRHHGDMTSLPRSVRPETPGPGQESVWDYPRPPLLERSSRHVVVRLGDRVVADSTAAYRVMETSHPPTWYLPPGDITPGALRASRARSTVCEWKGSAAYWDVLGGEGEVLEAAGWSYPRPNSAFGQIRDYVAFMPTALSCWVDGERVRPQEGGFYGGWITSDVVGPFKGIPGSWGW